MPLLKALPRLVHGRRGELVATAKSSKGFEIKAVSGLHTEVLLGEIAEADLLDQGCMVQCFHQGTASFSRAFDVS